MKTRTLPMFMVFLLGLIFTGCTATNSQPVDFNTAIVKNEASIRLFAGTSTTVYLLNTPVASRTATARKVYEVAAAINTAVQENANTSPVTLGDVDALIQELIAQSGGSPTAGAILNTIRGFIETEVQKTFTNAPPDSTTKMIQVLLRGASAGVMDATGNYTDGVPVAPKLVPKALRPSAAPKILVVPFDWQPKSSEN